MNNIIELDVKILHPHPSNPRKDLGDLTELSESIKQTGVMQNLTVVPHDEIPGEYTVIIGHRRLSASKLAGLKKVPCVITEMDDKEQLATMMLENMQRSDLTTYEQAQGFQLMMDFGESVESISQKTGLSASTVRNRVKLAKYDKDTMREAAVRQPTMAQYMRLCEIEDVDLANKVAKYLGTVNFDDEVNRALRLEKEKKQKNELMCLVNSIATKYEGDIHEDVTAKKIISCQILYTPLTDREKEDALSNKEKYRTLWYSEGYGVTLFRKYVKGVDDKPTEYDLERQKRSDFEQRVKDLYEEMEDRADAFVAGYPGRKSDIPILTQYLFECSMRNKWGARYNVKKTARFLGWTLPEGVTEYEDKATLIAEMWLVDRYSENPAKTLLTLIYNCYSTSCPCRLFYNSTKLDRESESGGWGVMFNLLEQLGYNVSDRERAFIDGTHEIYSEEVPL